MTPDPKPRKRHVATPKEWAQLRRVFELDPCWICEGRWTELHHLLPRSQRGDDLGVNLVPLCAACHKLVTENDPQAKAALRSALRCWNLNYIADRAGPAWLDARYPVAA